MGYTREYLTKPQMKKRPWQVHPVWRGIGCILLILIPILSYSGAVLLVDRNLVEGWIPTPEALMQTISIPVVNQEIPHLYANLMVAGVLLIVAYAGMMIVYTITYRFIGPSQLGPLDAEPIQRKRKQKYKTRR